MLFGGRDLVALPEREMNALRWRDIAFIPQSAMNSLDPVYTVEYQLNEVLRRRGGLDRAQARKRCEELFEMVGIEVGRLRDFPHQFSGGMRQRVAIALALALNPKLVIADEPVTALDVIVQRQILDQLRELQQRARHLRHPRHARHFGRRLYLRPHGGDVCRPRRRAGADGGGAHAPVASLHDGPA